jgi:hypothetical protein
MKRKMVPVKLFSLLSVVLCVLCTLGAEKIEAQESGKAQGASYERYRIIEKRNIFLPVSFKKLKEEGSRVKRKEEALKVSGESEKPAISTGPYGPTFHFTGIVLENGKYVALFEQRGEQDALFAGAGDVVGGFRIARVELECLTVLTGDGSELMVIPGRALRDGRIVEMSAATETSGSRETTSKGESEKRPEGTARSAPMDEARQKILERLKARRRKQQERMKK